MFTLILVILKILLRLLLFLFKFHLFLDFSFLSFMCDVFLWACFLSNFRNVCLQISSIGFTRFLLSFLVDSVSFSFSKFLCLLLYYNASSFVMFRRRTTFFHQIFVFFSVGVFVIFALIFVFFCQNLIFTLSHVKFA